MISDNEQENNSDNLEDNFMTKSPVRQVPKQSFDLCPEAILAFPNAAKLCNLITLVQCLLDPCCDYKRLCQPISQTRI